MKIVVLGGNGLLGRAVAEQFAARGHQVLRAARTDAELCVDFRYDLDGDTLRSVVRGADIVVNCVGILIERDGNTWDLVHRRAAEVLAAACEAERVARVIQVSALGAGSDIPGGYMASKLAAERAFAKHAVDYAIVRPGMLVDPACPSTQLFQWLASMPVIALPGLRHSGTNLLAPIQVSDVAACIARVAEHPKALRRVIELAGTEVLSYRAMLARYRAAQGKGPALWLPLPWWVMRLTAWLAQALPQKVFSLDTLRMLQTGAVASPNEVRRWLGRDALPLLAPPMAGAPAEVVSIG